jgi:hypothetical protein
MAVSHFCIDWLKFAYQKSNFYQDVRRSSVYVVDQILHVLSIITICKYYNSSSLEILSIGSYAISQYFLKYLLMFLLIFKPVNVTFAKLFAKHKPLSSKSDQAQDDIQTGKIIGNLERLLVLILLTVNQYAAIGLIFTAKSITRYDKISHDKAFAEYYLLGTLFSILSTLIIYVTISKIF